MDKKILGYFLVAGVIVFGGIYLYNKNKGKGSTTTSGTNDATKAGMPFALDISKIQITGNNGTNLYQYANSATPIGKSNDGTWYLEGGTASSTIYYYYEPNGSFIKVSSTPPSQPAPSSEVLAAQAATRAAQVAGATAAKKAGMPYSIDMTNFSPYTSKSYMNYTYLGNNMDSHSMLFKGINDNLIYCYSMNDGSWVSTYDPNTPTPSWMDGIES
jgi:hypothetical protein